MSGRWTWWAIIVAGLLVLWFVLACMVGATVDGSARAIERASAFISVFDDLLIRILATTLIFVAGIGIIKEEGGRLFSNREGAAADSNESANDEGPSKGTAFLFQERYFVLLKFAAMLAVSGLGFAAAYTLDENDNLIYGNIPGDGAGEAVLVPTPPPPTILAQWAQLAPQVDEDGNGACVLQPGESPAGPYEECAYDFLVRAVVPEGEGGCPNLTVTDSYGVSKPRHMSERANPYQWGFSEIKVCEARIPGSDHPKSAALPGENEIPLTANWNDEGGPGEVSIVGDTGCRASGKQVCTETDWPMRKVIAQQTSEGPDLVIHVGDFMYVKFDAWNAWKAEFFDPAAALLMRAPWVMARGNHERCGEFGDAPFGYYLFFDVGPVAGLDCSTDGKPDNQELTATYGVDLPNKRRIIVSDSSTAYAQFATEDDKPVTDLATGLEVFEPLTTQKPYQDVMTMMQQVKALAVGRGDKRVWFTSHVPVYALEACQKGQDAAQTRACKSDPAATIMRAAWLTLNEPEADIEVILAGHMHLFEILKPTKTNGKPLQIVSGAGGVNLDPLPYPDDNNANCVDVKSLDQYGTSVDIVTATEEGLLVNQDKAPVKVCSNKNFGYVRAVGDTFTFIPVQP